MVFQFNFPTTIRFGAGVSEEISQQLMSRGCKSPLLVTDEQMRGLPIIENAMISPMEKAGLAVHVYSAFSGNPIKSHVEMGVDAYKSGGCDSLVIVGGGAALDVGKAIALMAAHPGDLFDYEDGKPDGRPTDQTLPFMIAVPTTAGTGSEVGRSSVISDDHTKAKKIIFAPQMLPNVVIADPKLTYGLPPAVTAATGIDALTHLLEAYLVDTYHPMCDGIALQGIYLVSKSLEKAVKTPNDLAARSDMLMASMMGAVAFQKGLGVNHSCAHALSTVFDLHHGLANALVLPACMKFNLVATETKFATIAQHLSLDSAEAVIHWIEELIGKIHLKMGLKHYGVSINDRLLDVALADICHPSNPRKVERDDFKQLYESAL